MLDRIFKNKTFMYIYTLVLFLLACTITLTNQEINGVIVFLYIASAALILSSRLTDAMLPALLLCVFVTRCYNSADAFIARIPFFVPVVIAVVLHFVLYRRKIRIGRSFFGLCAVTVAVTLGGIGTIPPSDYFAGAALYYVFGLGIGMVLFYLLVKANFTEESGREVARILYIMGLFACFCVLRFYVADWQTVIETKRFVEFQSSNNLATFLMIAMPIPLFYASRRYVDALSVLLIYVCTVLTGSRGGLLMGTIEFLVILLAFALLDRRHKVQRILYLSTVVVFIGVMVALLPTLASFFGFSSGVGGEEATLFDYIEKLKGYFFREGEARVRLLERMVEDFKTNPVFGVGIGYTGNSDIYNPVKGAMNWYHMWFAQVIGGLGIVGILAYGYQLVERLIVFIKNRNLLNFTFLLSYLGLFLMSQVNPGEFCPMPYTALGVTFFILMEKKDIDVSGWWEKFTQNRKRKKNT